MKLGMEIVRLAGVAGSTLSAKQSIEKAFSTVLRGVLQGDGQGPGWGCHND
jgi:hypothetical protein